ncbi:fimbrial protein [Pantoea sp. Z09]|uniref:fimbrial protein n=1 Tax=Pantoea sp. Z09 TaxID=2886821 RepID=UPI001EFD1F40|nr:fimbrial protein [Pantoea sp. Z09]
MKRSYINSGLAVLFSLIGFHATADENMLFHGTLVDFPSCTINDNQPINVEFGNVGINKIDGVNYEKDIDYKIVCDGTDTQHQLYLSVTGQAASFNAGYLNTSVDGLAIEIKQNSEAYKLADQMPVTLDAPPKLSAVPVKSSDAALATGEFSASATLQAFYQ